LAANEVGMEAINL